MKDRLYDIMNWARIEAVVYSEEDQPHDFLGATVTDKGILIQTFLPTAQQVEVLVSGQSYPMTREDEEGFFAALLPGKKVPDYTLRVTFDEGEPLIFQDAYRFVPEVPENRLERFAAGICYDIYELLGAHPMEIDGVAGVYFAVWAPGALRVSVVGDFNGWDGRRLPMRRLGESGVFDLFVPQLKSGELYKYEIKTRKGLIFTKADPYAFGTELRPGDASRIQKLSDFTWTDAAFMEKRAQQDMLKQPVSITEISLANFRKPEDGREFYNYRELAEMIADYAVDMGYTHVELLPVMEYPEDETEGYQTSGFYAPTSRFGSPADFMYFMNYLHGKGIGVILDWAPSHFSRVGDGLAGFDGTCLYEHYDPRKGVSPKWNTLIFNYGSPQVSNFLIGSALFWAKVYHADGIRMDAVSSMLYLDYDRQGGSWLANIYGSNEDLEAIEFIKHLNSIFHRQLPGVLMIAEEEGAWPQVTGSLADGGLGFDLKWNEGWSEDFLDYMQLDPIFRGRNHGDLTLSMDYAYCENYMLPLSHRECGGLQESLISRMPGREEMKFANLRAAFGLMMTHPGKKLLCASQDFGQKAAWSVDKALAWPLEIDAHNLRLQAYVKALNELYCSHPALYEKDYEIEGFEWVNSISANENMLVFLRHGATEDLLVVCNFSALEYEDHKIGVPYAGKYKEIFNSDREIFGGSGHVNGRVKLSKKDECDAREDSIRIMVPPMGIAVFSCTKAEAPASQNEKAKTARKASAKKSTGTAGTKKTASGKKSVKAASSKEKKSTESLKETLARKVQEES